MATSAHSTSNTKNTLVEPYMEGIGMVGSGYLKTYDIRTDDQPAVRMAPMTGVGQVPTWDGSADFAIKTHAALDAKTITYVARAMQVRIGKLDLKDIPGIREAVMRKIGFHVASTKATLAAVPKAQAFSTSEVHGTKALCASDHETAGGTRSNTMTSALDRTAVMTAINKFVEWVDYQDQPYNLSGAGFILEVGPSLTEAAHEAVRSLLSGSDNQSNVLGTYSIEILVNEHLTDANDWFLHSKIEKPLLLWERSPDEISSNIDQDNGALKINVFMATSAHVKALPDGIVGSAVA